MDISPVTLEAKHVRLDPLALKHADDLFAVSRNPEIWELLIAPSIETLEEMRTWIEKAEIANRCWHELLVRDDSPGGPSRSWSDIVPEHFARG